MAEAEILGHTRKEAEDNARFIVEACNNYERLEASHKRLMEACKSAKIAIGTGKSIDSYVNDSLSHAVGEIDAAIAQAEEVEHG